MKVSELIECLENLDQDRIVVLSIDEEGNGYRLLEKDGIGGQNTAFDKENQEVGLERLTNALKEKGYCEEDVLVGGTPAVVFY